MLTAVRCRDTMSSFQPIKCRVPQGTRMGPLCILVLINDALLNKPFRWWHQHGYTCDTADSNTSPHYSNLQEILNILIASCHRKSRLGQAQEKHHHIFKLHHQTTFSTALTKICTGWSFLPCCWASSSTGCLGIIQASVNFPFSHT